MTIPSETLQAQSTASEAKLLATATLGITPSNPSPTETMLPNGTSEASLAKAHLTIKCLDISPALPENADLSGTVFLIREFINGKGYSAGSDVKVNLQTKTVTEITTPKNKSQGGYLVSPNGEQLAYFDFHYGANGNLDALNLIIENMNGKVLAKIPGNVDAWDTFYWLDNRRIVIGAGGQPTVYDPFTGERYGMEQWYAQSPGGLKTIPVWGVNGVFDSKLERLFYLQEDGTMLLWDLDQKQILTKIDSNGKYDPVDQPKWAWDDSQIVLAFTPLDSINSGDELFSVSRSGQITQLTQLGKYYSKVAITKFSWSPDGHLIAFFFIDMSKKNNPEQFAILDLATLRVTNYCNLGGVMNPNVEPVWSPDGTKVLVGRLESDQTTFKTILVDISDEYAAQLAENLVPAGWMVAPQP